MRSLSLLPMPSDVDRNPNLSGKLRILSVQDNTELVGILPSRTSRSPACNCYRTPMAHTETFHTETLRARVSSAAPQTLAGTSRSPRQSQPPDSARRARTLRMPCRCRQTATPCSRFEPNPCRGCRPIADDEMDVVGRRRLVEHALAREHDGAGRRQPAAGAPVPLHPAAAAGARRIGAEAGRQGAAAPAPPVDACPPKPWRRWATGHGRSASSRASCWNGWRRWCHGRG